MASVADYLIQQMQSFGALLLNHEQTEKLRAVCLPDGVANKKLVGKSPSALLEAAGLPLPAKAPRLLIAVVDADDSWVTSEQLMPMLPIVKVNDFDSALTLALNVEDSLHHTAIMHSQNISRLNLAARVMQTSIFVKNGPSGWYWRRRRRFYDLHHCYTDRRRDNVSPDFCPLTTLCVNQRLFHSLEKRK